jgi:hypothetical protein
MKKEVSPVQAIMAVLLTIVVIGGIWWFVKGRGPAPANPQDVERMLQGEHRSASPAAAPGGGTR